MEDKLIIDDLENDYSGCVSVEMVDGMFHFLYEDDCDRLGFKLNKEQSLNLCEFINSLTQNKKS